MKLLLIVLLSVLSYHCCSGYPVAEGGLSEDLLQNGTSTENLFDSSNQIASNDSSPLVMLGLGKKIFEKVREGIRTVKDKVKGGFDKVKDKIKGGFDKVKDTIKDFKDKTGSNGGSRNDFGGEYYRDKYVGDYDKDNNRDYYLKNNFSGGSGFSVPNAKWISLGIGIFMLVCILGVIICFICKIEKD